MQSRNSVVLILVAALWAQGDVGVMLGGFERRLPGANGSASAVHVSDVNALSAYWGRPNAWRGGGRQPIDRSLAYLSALQPHALQDPALAVAIASAYRQIGLAQEPYARDGALSAYTSSALLYSRMAGTNPGVRNDLMWLNGRVGGLGGSLPFLVNYPMAGIRRGPDGLDAVKANAVPQRVTAAPGLVKLPDGITAPPELTEQFAYTAAHVHATNAAVQPIKESVATMGQSLHPDTIFAMTRMQNALAEARKQIMAGQFEEAKENLSVASALSQRVGKQFGR